MTLEMLCHVDVVRQPKLVAKALLLALRDARGVRTLAAIAVGISIRTYDRWCAELGIESEVRATIDRFSKDRHARHVEAGKRGGRPPMDAATVRTDVPMKSARKKNSAKGVAH